MATAVCIEHRGGYDNFADTVAVVYKYINEHPLSICAAPRFCYIHGVRDCNYVEDWLTEVQLPVRRICQTW